MCNTCNLTKCGCSPVRYTGEDLPCTGILKNDTIDVAFEKVSNYVCDIVFEDGADGASAYDIAITDGFVGTEAEWLLSLVGADGADGADGQGSAILHRTNGYEINGAGSLTPFTLDNTLMPNDNDGLRISYVMRSTVIDTGVITFTKDGNTIFIYTLDGVNTGIIVFHILIVRDGLDMRGTISSNSYNGVLPQELYFQSNGTNWFSDASVDLTVTSTATLATTSIGEWTIELLKAI